MPSHSMEGESIERTFLTIHAIAEFRGEWFNVKQIMVLTGLPSSTMHRYLPVFVRIGVLEREVRSGVIWYRYCYKRK